ncbi:methyltransferase family protein [Paraburkholderia sp. BL10I2N1]|nr:methyltransferase family protein [Paraburkholderia sp. BL10I2N1]
MLVQRDALLSAIEVRAQENGAASPANAPAMTHEFMGYQIPIDLMLLTGGGPESFDIISASHTANLQRWIGLEPDHTLLEVGCGIGRDAIPLTQILRNGRYIGIDIIGKSIEWCQKNIAARHSNFEFHHFNVEDQLHNSQGTTKTADITLPAENNSIDRIILFSVFTHMFQADIEHYLGEFRRVLKPDGMVYATTFIFNDEILHSARATNLTPFDLRFEYEATPGCRINDPVHPLGAVAYTKETWDVMSRRSGLRYAKPFLKGAWSGFYPDPQDGQDVVILTPDSHL